MLNSIFRLKVTPSIGAIALCFTRFEDSISALSFDPERVDEGHWGRNDGPHIKQRRVHDED
jgi:hypothetical protein